MSRFASVTATRTFFYRGCACPGRPHARDFLDIRAELGALELAELDVLSPAGRLRKLIVSWNLLDDDGQTAPITDDYLTRLFADEYEALDVFIARNVRVTALPKGRAARFRNGLRAALRTIRTSLARG